MEADDQMEKEDVIAHEGLNASFVAQKYFEVCANTGAQNWQHTQACLVWTCSALRDVMSHNTSDHVTNIKPH